MAIHVAIEGYDSLEQIGIGGMAAVYKARKISLDKTVAIKVLFPYLATDPTFTDRFQREAKAAASIQHDNVVNVIDFGETEGSCYIVMEYYDGRTLEALMRERRGIPADVAAQILLEVAYGLEAAHTRDIVHRDIKPGNIIYTRQGGIKIADFGLARKSDSASLITQHGKVVGTPAYMSPEQAAGRPVGPASDIFSLGVVAYELFGRRKPFEGASYSEVIEKIQTRNQRPVTEINPLIEPVFEHVVERMLAKNEGDRHANATELIADLEAAMDEAGMSRDRRRLAAYISNPGAYETRQAKEMIARCLSRGGSFLHQGPDHFDDARLEFQRVLFLDPTHRRALSSLQRIRHEHGDRDRTIVLDAVDNAPSTAAPPPPARRGPARKRRARRRVSGWMYSSASMSELPQPAASPLIGDAFPDASSADSSLRVEQGLDRPEIAEADTTAGAEPAALPDAGGPARTAAADTRRPETPPATTSAVAGAPAQKQRTGTLSVFFLGGVGEVMLNGKRFEHQPPFEGVEMPAGSYRMACRMSGDARPREIVVTIVAGRETIVEYETGGEPVASLADAPSR